MQLCCSLCSTYIPAILCIIVQFIALFAKYNNFFLHAKLYIFVPHSSHFITELPFCMFVFLIDLCFVLLQVLPDIHHNI